MIGLTSFGAYVPRLRLDRATIGAAWERAAGKGTVAIGNYDEDPLTMAVAALDRALADHCISGIEGCYFASTSAPYREKNHAAFVAACADLERGLLTADFGGSLRCGTQALLAALHAVAAGRHEIAVAAADQRTAKPGSPEEATLGDGAAAFTVGSEDVLVEFVDSISLAEEFADVWRTADEEDLHVGDAKFNIDHGYGRFMREAMDALLDKVGAGVEHLSRVVLFAPDARTHGALAKGLGVSDEQLVPGAAATALGNSGAALSLLQLVQALADAAPGDLIMVLSHGGGADALLFRATERITEHQDKTELGGPERSLTSYQKFLLFRGHMPSEPINPFTSPALLWKEQDVNLPLKGTRCSQCEAIQFPPRYVCWRCGAEEDFTPAKLSRQGTIVTCAKDHLVPTPDPPVVMASVDLDGGGRLYSQVTDCDPAEVKPGVRVECTLRRLHEGDGFPHYFWKFRPVA